MKIYNDTSVQSCMYLCTCTYMEINKLSETMNKRAVNIQGKEKQIKITKKKLQKKNNKKQKQENYKIHKSNNKHK